MNNMRLLLALGGGLFLGLVLGRAMTLMYLRDIEQTMRAQSRTILYQQGSIKALGETLVIQAQEIARYEAYQKWRSETLLRFKEAIEEEGEEEPDAED